ncbi:16S rRNA (uracil(1498)-N(3))-methyltransferase [Marivirga sp.]|uniref:16S rRNA (uracil(1498)-N(3))-methyltransferase n=1 Tax=Marivirga sp. TaxID=2018662 RepID=UPI002D7E3E64|nr:16S rRNA (uracil(1498)-N(3))-methyltransferase [Marivirga sp.]HET8859151.1 16S rRNA (uracil(1498)-N(3))-methyltransferase [Marivirga sp.]
MQIFYQSELPNVNYLEPEESKHCIKVLRKQLGDEIQIIDGKGTFYKAKISNVNHKKCEFEVFEKINDKKPTIHRHLAIAPTKNLDRMEWLVEKATEIGIDEISFLECQNSERNILKLDRLEKKVVSAMKQSIKAYQPRLNELRKFKDFISSPNAKNKYIAFVDFDNPLHFKTQLRKQEDALILIGPEGDFTKEEIELARQNGFVSVSLGNSRLRTETAGIVAIHLMNLGEE